MEPATKKLLAFIVFLVIVIAGAVAFTIYNPFKWSWLNDIKKCDPCAIPPIVSCDPCPDPPKCENNIYFANTFIRLAQNNGIVCKIINKNIDDIYPNSDNAKFMKITIRPNVLGLMSNSTFFIEYYDCSSNDSILTHLVEFRTSDVTVSDNLITFKGYSVWDSSVLTDVITVETGEFINKIRLTTYMVTLSESPTKFDYNLEILSNTTIEEAVSHLC